MDNYIIGIDLAKEVFHLHGIDQNEQSVLAKKLRRSKFAAFVHDLPPCIIAMEACGGAHHFARLFKSYGHTVKLLAPQHVKAYAREQKNDHNDAKAIAIAAARPSMTFVGVKSEDQQAVSMLYHYRQASVRARTKAINALRGHMTEFGIVVPKGSANIKKLAAILNDADGELPELAIELGQAMLVDIDQLSERISNLNRQISNIAKETETTKRMMSIPGVGEMSAIAIHGKMPDLRCYKNGRGFAAALGLVPRQNSTGGRTSLGRITKTGQRDIRRLLYCGAVSVLNAAARKPDEQNPPWLVQMMKSGKPFKVVAVALANKIARMIWAVTTKQEMYKAPLAAAAK